MLTLHLNLHRKWFDMILKGDKKEEYRIISEYWLKRLINAKKRGVKTITFSNGYSKDRPQFIIEIIDIRIGKGKVKWGADQDDIYIIIYLGKIIGG